MNGKDGKTEKQENLMGQTFGYDTKAEGEEETPTPETPKAEEPKKEETPKAEESVVETPTEEEVETPPTEPEVSPEEELATMFTGGEDEDEEEEEEEETPAGEEHPADEPEEISLELDDDQFDEITQSKEKFSEYISKVRKATLEEARKEFKEELATAREEILRDIPQLVGKSAKRVESVRQLTQNFYATYPDLVSKKQYVQDQVALVSSQNSDWSAKQVLEEVGKRAERDLSVSAKAEQREKKRTDEPKFAGAGGRRTPGKSVDNRTKQEKLLDATF